jgi:hypothetical protein
MRMPDPRSANNAVPSVNGIDGGEHFVHPPNMEEVEQPGEVFLNSLSTTSQPSNTTIQTPAIENGEIVLEDFINIDLTDHGFNLNIVCGAVRDMGLWNSGAFGYSMYPVSLIADSNLPTEDLQYLRYMFHEISPSRYSIAGTILRLLWSTYGYTFSEPSSPVLRSSVLAAAVVGMSFQGRTEVPFQYNGYTREFTNGFNQAKAEGTLDETHLFGLYFVIGNIRAEKNLSLDFDRHLTDFCETLDRFNREARAGRQFPLRHVWRLMLSFLRRGYASPSGHALSIHDKDALFLRMHDLDMQISSDHNLGGTINRFVGSSYYSGEERCRRLSRGWDVSDILCSLKAKFRESYKHYPANSSPEIDFHFGRFMESIRAGTDGFERFRYLHKAFEVCPFDSIVDSFRDLRSPISKNPTVWRRYLSPLIFIFMLFFRFWSS